jgi:hypothetical protein
MVAGLIAIFGDDGVGHPVEPVDRVGGPDIGALVLLSDTFLVVKGRAKCRPTEPVVTRSGQTQITT